MLTNLTEVKYDVPALAVTFGNYLVEHADRLLDCTNVHAHTQMAGARWNNPENIESGVSGHLLFLLELYRRTGTPRYLRAADQAIASTLAWCEERPTANYSLCTGRSGFVYVLMERYLISKDARLAEAMLNIIRNASQEYLHSTYTTDYFYDGRSGTLLLLLQLYRLTGDASLLDQVNEFVQKIVANARLTPQGACWYPADEMNLRPSCGFARGTAGLAYVLGLVNHYCHNEALDFLLHEIRRYTASCWVDEYDNWGDYGKDLRDSDMLRACRGAYRRGDDSIFVPGDRLTWGEGAAGILFSSPMLAGNKKAGLAEARLSAATVEVSDNGLFDGLAGVGMYYLQSGSSPDELEAIVETLAGRLSAMTPAAAIEGGFMHNGFGALYFLLKATTEERSDNLLFPFWQGLAVAPAPKLALTAGARDIRNNLLAACYPRTKHVLTQFAGDRLSVYFDAPPEVDTIRELARFTQFVRDEVCCHFSPNMQDCLLDLLLFEEIKCGLRHKQSAPRLQTYLQHLEYEDNILIYLNRPDEWMEVQPMMIAANILTVHTRWDWSFKDDFEPLRNKTVCDRFMSNFATPPADFEYLLRIDRFQQVEEIHCHKVFQLALHCFTGPKSIRQAAEEIRHYVHSLDRKGLETLLVATGASRATTPEEFVEQLDEMIVDSIKPIIHRNILSFESFKQNN